MFGAACLMLLGTMVWPYAEAPLSADEKLLQGTWEVVALEESGESQPESRYKDVKLRMIISGRKIAQKTTGPNGKEYSDGEMAFVLNEKVSPKEIDFSKGERKGRGIYLLEKSTLKLCIDIGDNPRPSDFKTKKRSAQKLYILKKAEDPSDPKSSQDNASGLDPKKPNEIVPPKDVSQDAEKLLNWALQQAKADKKHVMLVVGTKSCVPCRQLDGLLTDLKPILNKYLILIKLDLDVENADEVHNRLRKKDLEGGGNAFLPWIIILNGAGETLSKSGKQVIGEKDSVIGLPHGKEEDRRYFVKMLRTSCPGITEDELVRVYDSATSLHRQIWGDKGSYSSGKYSPLRCQFPCVEANNARKTARLVNSTGNLAR